MSSVGAPGACFSTEMLERYFFFELQRYQRARLNDRNSARILPLGAASCPLLRGGECTQQCANDANCGERDVTSPPEWRLFLKCCANGCGSECVLAPIIPTNRPVADALYPPRTGSTLVDTSLSQQQFSARPIMPVGNSLLGRIIPDARGGLGGGAVRSGVCPPVTLLSKCAADCAADGDCAGVEKCCKSECGRVCASPEKASNCVHLLSAVERLRGRTLARSFVPSCSPRGNFNPIQCDEDYCWCVGSETGNEIYGTKKPKRARAFLNCQEIRSCGALLQNCIQKSVRCEFGFQTDENGCPFADCSCRNLCDELQCENEVDSCQLVEPDCARLPCVPVPKCLLNPCSLGQPMKLSNGVTALCKQSTQCWDGFWCHQVGYNGLGFCCPEPQPKIKQGVCEARLVAAPLTRNSKPQANCSSECRSDEECPSVGKCCFDGCGLKCFYDISGEKITGAAKVGDSTQTENKELLISYPKLAKCPADSKVRLILQHKSTGDSSSDLNKDDCSECETDADCEGLRLCCSVALEGEARKNNAACRVCVFSLTTTKCLHDAITQDFYGNRAASKMPAFLPQCAAPSGEFEAQQCNSEFCFCVYKHNGAEIPNTRTPNNLHQSAQMCEDSQPRGACPLRRCENSCASGEFLRDENGCATCTCANPCGGIACRSDEICILARVDCIGANCAPQPRCIMNFCPRGERPLLLAAVGGSAIETTLVAEQCADICPLGYRCYNVGLPGRGGICCPSTSLQQQQQQQHQQCPQHAVLLIARHTSRLCSLECRGDHDCDADKKCCFNGCGTRCLLMAHSSSFITKNTLGTSQQQSFVVGEDERLGECPISANRLFDSKSAGTNCALLQNSLARGAHNRTHAAALWRMPCSRDANCAPLQKCCTEACTGRKKCQFPQKNTACLHLKAAYLQSGAPDFAANLRCTNDGTFAMVQCGWQQCWCVDENSGNEIEGTRTSSAQSPNCNEPKKCDGQRCASKQCPHGFEKDEAGCNTCECADPCKRLKCPQKSGLICVPEKVECLAGRGQCAYMPKCVPNVCGRAADSILIRRDNFRPETCQKKFDCPADYYCRILNSGSGLCCFGNEPPMRVGRCPQISEWVLRHVEPEFCDVECFADADCSNSKEKCCFNGCGLSCMPSLPHESRQKSQFEVQEAEPRNMPKISGAIRDETVRDECGQIEPFDDSNFCNSKAPPFKSCVNDGECGGMLKCCSTGCERIVGGETAARFCVFPSVATRCQQARAAAQLVLSVFPNNVFLPNCDASGEFEAIQRHNGVAWCVDKQTGLEIQGTKSASIALTSCANIQPKSCPILACSLNCPYGYETDLLGCQVCVCLNPCRDVRCSAQHVCRMTKVKCTTSARRRGETCHTFVPRCVLNACPIGEPLQDDTSKQLLRCADESGCPASWFCHDFGMADGAYCCRSSAGSKPSATPRNSARCPRVAPMLSINFVTPFPFFNGATRALVCRINENCGAGMTCCFNGRDTSCVTLKKSAQTTVNNRLGDSTGSNSQEESGSSRLANDISREDRREGAHFAGRAMDGMVLKKSAGAGVCPGDLGMDASNEALLPARKSARLNFHKLLDEKQNCEMGNECDTDTDCANAADGSTRKCCSVGGDRTRCRRRACVQPFRATNCVNYLVAILRLQKRHIIHNLYTPYCDSQNGNYRSNQCDDSEGWCWCVDVTSGRPALGSRALQPTFDVCKLDGASRCAIACDEKQSSSNCPFGVEMNENGCPKSPQCRCYLPCADVRCPRGELCIMRARLCQEDVCLPAPVCEANPCPAGRQPARAANIEGALLTCHSQQNDASDNDLILGGCPSEHFCTSLDENSHGICCPGKNFSQPSSKANNKQRQPTVNNNDDDDENDKDNSAERQLASICLAEKRTETLPNLVDYFRHSSDIQETGASNMGSSKHRTARCQSDASCLRSHVCVHDSRQQNNGICCPTSRSVCAQALDIGYGGGGEVSGKSANVGNCARLTNVRFYFDAAIDACVEFIYGGCGGNLNNFLTSADCEEFCLGTPTNNSAQNNDANAYTVGFTMRIPPALARDEKQRKRFESVLREHVIDEFKENLRDVSVLSNGTVKLTFNSADDAAAKRQAERALDMISMGNFRVPFDETLYVAEPKSASIQRREADMLAANQLWDANQSEITLFWIITIATLLFALIVVIILCSGYNFLRVYSARARRDNSISPTSYGSVSGYNPQQATSEENGHRRADNRPQQQQQQQQQQQRSGNSSYHNNITIPSTARHLRVISLPHQPQTHLLTISSYNNRNSGAEKPEEEDRSDSSRYTSMLLTPAHNSPLRNTATTVDVAAAAAAAADRHKHAERQQQQHAATTLAASSEQASRAPTSYYTYRAAQTTRAVN